MSVAASRSSQRRRALIPGLRHAHALLDPLEGRGACAEVLDDGRNTSARDRVRRHDDVVELPRGMRGPERRDDHCLVGRAEAHARNRPTRAEVREIRADRKMMDRASSGRKRPSIAAQESIDAKTTSAMP